MKSQRFLDNLVKLIKEKYYFILLKLYKVMNLENALFQ